MRRKSRHRTIVCELGSAIVRGEILPGEKLPAAATLCEKYRVSRPVVREALRSLSVNGLVMSKPRLGSVARPRSDWRLLDPDVLSWTIAATPPAEFFTTLLALRQIVEPAAAALAAVHANEEDLARIEGALQRMGRASRPEELVEPDLHFHQAIMAATHNSLLVAIGDLLSLAITESIRLTSQSPNPNMHALTMPRHRAILTAIRNQDALGARQASLVQLKATNVDANVILGIEQRSEV